jgi:hypothetical protein
MFDSQFVVYISRKRISPISIPKDNGNDTTELNAQISDHLMIDDNSHNRKEHEKEVDVGSWDWSEGRGGGGSGSD